MDILLYTIAPLITIVSSIILHQWLINNVTFRRVFIVMTLVGGLYFPLFFCSLVLLMLYDQNQTSKNKQPYIFFSKKPKFNLVPKFFP